MNDSELDRIIGEISDLPPGAREEAIEAACAGDDGLAAKVRSLLRIQDDVLDAGSEGASPFHDFEGIGSVFGDYRIRSLLGEGGMGTVYLAEQSQPIRRQVALKVLRFGADSRRIVARFEREKRTLALLDHPGIAKIFDAGVSPSGRPYYSMEYVRGAPIDRYCDENRLSLPQRLRLFVDVCAAIQHAHQKGVIHRDIKPSNVLVGDESGAPVPKVIDFGIAKAIGPRVGTELTEAYQFLGTASYMSPEQLKDGVEVDTRTDVYSLGVLLYELMTGRTPFEDDLRDGGIAQLARLVVEKEPRRPSQRVAELAREDSNRIAAHRRTGSRSLPRALRGELDWVVLRALDKDRNRRYGTVQELADDVKQYLEDRPVRARPPSNLYRFRKHVRRNKLVVALAILLAVVFVSGFGSTYRAFLRASRAEAAAKASHDEALALADDERGLRREREALNAKMGAAIDYLQRVLRFSDIAHAPGEELTRRGLVDFLAADIDVLSEFPDWYASSNALIGNGYYGLREFELAERHLREADRIFAAKQEREIRFSLRAEHVFANLEGCRNASEWLAVKRTLHRALTDNVRLLEWERDGFFAMMGCWYLGAHVLAQDDERLGVPAKAVLDATTALVADDYSREQLLPLITEGAATLAREATQLAVDSPMRMIVDDQLWIASLILQSGSRQLPDSQGLRTATIDLLALLLDLRRDTLPRFHPEIGTALLELAEAMMSDHRRGAVVRINEAIELRTRVYGEAHVSVVAARAMLGRASIQLGRTERGLELLEPSVGRLRDELGTTSRAYADALEAFVAAIANDDELGADHVAELRADLIECYAALPLIQGGSALVERRNAAFSGELAPIRSRLRLLWDPGNPSPEETLRGLLGDVERLGLEGRPAMECIAAELGGLAQFYVVNRRSKRGSTFAVMAAERAVEIYERAGVRPEHPVLVSTRLHLAKAHGDLQHPAEQERQARAVLDVLDAEASSAAWWFDVFASDARTELASALIALGRSEEALRVLRGAEDELPRLDLLSVPERKLLVIADACVDLVDRYGANDDATRIRRKLIELTSSTEDVRLLAGTAWVLAQQAGLDDEEYAAAIEFVDRAFARSGTSSAAAELLLIHGVLDYRRGNFDGASQRAGEATSVGGQVGEFGKVVLALAETGRGAPEEAERVLSSVDLDAAPSERAPTFLTLRSFDRLLREARAALDAR